MKCKNCGYEFDAKFCPECGIAASTGSDKIKCRKCGREVDSSLKYCPECGEHISGDYKNIDKDRDKDRNRRRRDRGKDDDDKDDDDEGGILGGIGNIVGKIFGG